MHDRRQRNHDGHDTAELHLDSVGTAKLIGTDSARIVSEIEAERRNGYAWYVSEPNELLEKDYPKWKEKIAKTK